MQIGKIKKELVCTVKDPALKSVKIFLVEILNLKSEITDDYVIAVENNLGLGSGDIVIVVQGSSARLISENRQMPVDCAISAKVEKINIDEKYKFLLNG